MTWSEGKVARILARNTFKDVLCALPNSTWTGDEIDLLVVPPCLRVVDVEIKISRADLKEDAKKDRWWRSPARRQAGPAQPVVYPRHVWKHYYALPVDIWRDDLVDCVQPISGVLVVSDDRGRHGLNGYAYGSVECVRRARPNKLAKPLDASAIREIARLASLRMWDAYRDLDRARDDHAKRIAMYERSAEAKSTSRKRILNLLTPLRQAMRFAVHPKKYRWCWNAAAMRRREAHRLLRYLYELGTWRCESGPTRLFRWFNREEATA